MSHLPDAPLFAILRVVARAAVSGFLMLSLSGGALLVQTAAWVQMARDAGGWRQLPEVISETPPCRLCEMANTLQTEFPGQQEFPAPQERLDWLRLGPVGEECFSAKAKTVEASRQTFFPPGSDSAPRAWSERPPTPPPRARVA